MKKNKLILILLISGCTTRQDYSHPFSSKEPRPHSMWKNNGKIFYQVRKGEMWELRADTIAIINDGYKWNSEDTFMIPVERAEKFKKK